MATPGELVKCVAEALGIPEPTVVLYDRVLAENGLRSKGGRGTSAARVTSGDAANLLIAILASPASGSSIKSATEVSQNIWAAPPEPGKRRRQSGNLQQIRISETRTDATLSHVPRSCSHAYRGGHSRRRAIRS
jgi:hypothetical protein